MIVCIVTLTCISGKVANRMEFITLFFRAYCKVVVFSIGCCSIFVVDVNVQALTVARCYPVEIFVSCTESNVIMTPPRPPSELGKR